MNKEKELHKDAHKELTTPCYRGWLSNYWEHLERLTPGWLAAERKRCFFALMAEMLHDNKAKFFPPEDPLGRLGKYWDAPPDEILEFMTKGWPENYGGENDDWWVKYFYEYLPAIAWLDSDNTWRSA